MPEYTSNLGLYKPNVNDSVGIASSLADNFSTIDSKLGNALKDKNNVSYSTLGERINADQERVENTQRDLKELRKYFLNPLHMDVHLRLVAHRGNSNAAPENTLSAIRRAIDCGFWATEFDIQLTADGEWVLHHDDTIDRTSDSTGILRNSTLASLRTHDFGSWWGSYVHGVDAPTTITPYAGEPIPTLDEALRACTMGKIIPIIEIKKGGGPEYTDGEIQGLVNKILSWGLEHKCAVAAFDLAHLVKLRNFNENIVVWYNSNDLSQTVIDDAKALGNAFLSINKDALLDPDNASLIEQIKSEGIPIAAWTVNLMDEIRDLLKLGVKTITTDYLSMIMGV